DACSPNRACYPPTGLAVPCRLAQRTLGLNSNNHKGLMDCIAHTHTHWAVRVGRKRVGQRFTFMRGRPFRREPLHAEEVFRTARSTSQTISPVAASTRRSPRLVTATTSVRPPAETRSYT